MATGWKRTIARSYLRGDTSKNTILFLSTLVSFSSLLLATGFHYGANQIVDTAQSQIVDSSFFKAAKKEYVETGDSSPLSLVKVMRPKREELGFLNEILPSCVITHDLSKFFPGNHEIFFEEKRIDNILFAPVYSYVHLGTKRNMLIAGAIPSSETIHQVVINKTFATTICADIDNLIGREFAIDIKTKITINDSSNNTVEDVFLSSIKLEICGIFDELSFLNPPKIFYSQRAVEDFLSSYQLEDLSDYFKRNITCMDIFELIDDNHYLTNYGLNVFVLSEEEIVRMFALSKTLIRSESHLAFESSSLMIKDTYQELTKATLYSMIIFIVIAFVGTCLIMALGAYSSYVSKKKESAILSCLGVNRNSIFDIFFYKNATIASLAIVSSFACAAIGQFCANQLFYKYFMIKNLISIPFTSFLDIPFFLVFIVFYFGYLTTLIFTYLPLRLFKTLSLAEELREN